MKGGLEQLPWAVKEARPFVSAKASVQGLCRPSRGEKIQRGQEVEEIKLTVFLFGGSSHRLTQKYNDEAKDDSTAYHLP